MDRMGMSYQVPFLTYVSQQSFNQMTYVIFKNIQSDRISSTFLSDIFMKKEEWDTEKSLHG